MISKAVKTKNTASLCASSEHFKNSQNFTLGPRLVLDKRNNEINTLFREYIWESVGIKPLLPNSYLKSINTKQEHKNPRTKQVPVF